MEGFAGEVAAVSLGASAGPPPGIDALLMPFIQARSEEESERALSQLISEHAAPVIGEVVGRRLRSTSVRAGRAGGDDSHTEDIRGDAVVQLLIKLRRLRTSPQDGVIGDLRAYAAVVADHACYRYLRRKHPQRHILKNRLRYLLTHQHGLALWEGDDGMLLAGFASWRAGRTPAAAQELERLERDWRKLVLDQETRRTRPAGLLAAIFDYLGGPVTLDELVNVVAKLWGVDDREETAPESAIALVSNESAGADAELESREFLRRLWDEIRQLPLRQRAALLLNLKDGRGGCIGLLPHLGVASMRQIAEALEMPAERLAEIWKLLPLDDAAIATELRLTRQQVINLRKSARARLARRTRDFI